MPCVACKVYNCTNPQTDLVQYSLQDSIAFNSGILSFVVTCPPSMVCAPGSFPITINFPPGTFTVILPPTTGGNDNNQPIVLSLQGCQSLVTITLPAGSSQAAINAAAQSIIMQVAAQQAQCNVTPIPPGTPPTTGPQPPIPPSPPGTIPIPIPTPQPQPAFFNEAVYFSKPCTSPAVLKYSLTLPSWITLDAANSRLIGNAGTFGGSSQSDANLTAQTILSSFGNAAVTAGTLTCDLSFCPDWAPMSWGAPVILNSDGSFGFSTGGASFAASVSCAVAGQESVRITSVVPYKSTGCNCNMHIVITGGTPQTGSGDARLRLVVNGFIQATIRADSVPVDYAFSLPDTAGVVANATIRIDLIATSDGSSNFFLNLNGTFSNLP